MSKNYTQSLVQKLNYDQKFSRIQGLPHRPIETLRVLLPEFNLPVGLLKYRRTSPYLWLLYGWINEYIG